MLSTLTRGVQHYGRRKETVWASEELFVLSHLSKRTSYNWYAWYLMYDYPGTAVYVFCISLKGTTFFCGQLLVPTSPTWSNGHSSGKIFLAAKLFLGLLECLMESSWSSLTCYAQLSKRTTAKNTWYLVLHTWYLICEYQVLLLRTCFVFQGATFCGQLLVREASQRWVGVVSRLQ